MLILAGVSLNAIIGDNGIITRAQEANIQSSIASLEEYLQLKYTENYEEMTKYQSKIEGLTNVCSEYFYIPIKEGIGGLWYVVDSDGHALYLIKKSGLPEEIRESLVGGDAGEGSYADYQSLNDVYGVTTNLKVYYCSGGVDSIKGLAKESLDNDNPLREVFDESSKMADLLNNYDVNKDGKINAEEVKSVKTFTIDDKSGVTNLSDLYNLNSLQELTLRNIKLDSFAGIENCSQINYICLENFTSDDYSKINSLENKLRYLYLINTTDDEVKKLCSSDKGIAKGAFSQLQYFALSGYALTINKQTFVTNSWNVSVHSDLTDVSALSNLDKVTKEAINYLSLNNNKITSIACLKEFKNVYLLRVETNNLTSLSGVDNMANLTYLYAGANNLGVDEVAEQNDELNDSLAGLSGKTKLYGVYLEGNANLKWIDYLKDSKGIGGFFLAGCGNLQGSSLSKVKDIYNNCSSGSKSIDEHLLKYLSGDDIFIYANLTEDKQNDINYLINLSQEDKNKVKKFDLSGSNLNNETLNQILENYNEIVCLNLDDCTELSSLDFLEGKSKLEQFCFLNTNVTGDEVKKIDQYTNVSSFRCNNVDIDLTKKQKTLNKATPYSGKYAFALWLAMGIRSNGLIKKLENCTDLKNLSPMGMLPDSDLEIDLTNTKINYVSLQNSGSILYEVDWKIPSSFTGISDDGRYSRIFGDGKQTLIFSEGTKISKLQFTQNAASNFENYFLKNLNSLKNSGSSVDFLEFIFHTSTCDYSRIFENDILNSIEINELKLDSTVSLKLENFGSFWKNKLQNATKLTMNNFIVNDLNFLAQNGEMTDISITNGSIIDVSGIENLTKLINLDLSNNSINNTYYLRNLKKLVKLNLTSNVLQSQYNYEEDGMKKSVNNLEILSNLNKNANMGGSLEKLYLKNNNLLTPTDYAFLTKYRWTDWAGF